jgi:predicted DNA-binding protein
MSDQIKFEVTCDQAFAQALDSLSSRLGKTRSDTIRDALNFYENAVNKWEKGKGSAKADKRNQLMGALEEAVKEFAEAKKELDAAGQLLKEAVEKRESRFNKVNALGEKKNQLVLDLQNFFHGLHSTKSAQEKEQ